MLSDSVVRTITNKYQGTDTRVLCVCSIGMLRSATMAKVLSEEYGHNTRSCGIHPNALIEFSEKLAYWADEIYCVESYIYHDIEDKLKSYGFNRDLFCFNIQDDYEYMQDKLVTLIKEKYEEIIYEK